MIESGDSSRKPLLPPACLGVLGGGQLGRMFIQAAQRMGYETVVLSATREAPAAQVAHHVVVGLPHDLSALRAFAERADAVTVEFENVSAPALRWLERRMPARPGWKALWTCQNRLREKSFLSRSGLPTAPWTAVRTLAELDAAPGAVGLPLILKTAASGYDGKGQVRVETVGELGPAWLSLNQVPCVAEGLVQFELEASVVVARGLDGESRAFPLAWNHHENHILDSTVMPAPVEPSTAEEARRLAQDVARALDCVGVLCVEFFRTTDGRWLVNEIAPRPHNSGHLTIEATVSSQFEQQVRALCGLPLGPTELIQPAAMVNLLGDLWVPGEPRWDRSFAMEPGMCLHLYGKKSASVGRKMGHLTVLDPDAMNGLKRALAARNAAIA